MARQRRFLSHHRHHQHHPSQNNNHQNQQQQQMISHNVDHNQQVISIGGESCSAAGQVNPVANWVYWPNGGGGGGSSSVPVPVVVAAEAPRSQPQVVADLPPVQVQNSQQPVQGQNFQQRQVNLPEKRQVGYILNRANNDPYFG